jgi:hypothetical protein
VVRQIKDPKEKQEEALHMCRESRKQYLIEYFLALLLFLLLFFFKTKGVYVPKLISYFVSFFIIALLVIPEWRRIIGFQYFIYPTKITSINGLIKQKRKNIHFFALSFIPDININQTRMQRILNYGTVYISGGEKNTLNIRDVDKPRKVMTLVEDLINKKRNERDAAEGKHTS